MLDGPGRCRAGKVALILGEPARLGDYLRQRMRAARMLVVIADQEQAVLRRLTLTAGGVQDAETEQRVEGSAIESVHKPRGNWLSHSNAQNSADEAAKRNIRDVVEQVTGVVRSWKPDVLVAAGETKGRKLLLDELPKEVEHLVEEVSSGGGIPTDSADAGGEESLENDLADLARKLLIEQARSTTERFREAKAGDLAVEGVEDLRRALQLGAVDTLLLPYDQRAGGDALTEDQLIAEATGTDAEIALVGGPITDEVAALLRYKAPVDQLDG